MSKLMRVILVALVVAGLAASAVSVQAAVPVGTRFKGMTLPDPDGRPVNLGRYVGQKVLVLIYWSLTCGQCAKDLPKIFALMKEYRNKAVLPILVNGDGTELSDAVKKYMEKNKIVGYISVVDKLEIDDYEFKKRFRILATPGIYVINRAGKVIYCKDGAADIPALAGTLNDALAGGGGR